MMIEDYNNGSVIFLGLNCLFSDGNPMKLDDLTPKKLPKYCIKEFDHYVKEY